MVTFQSALNDSVAVRYTTNDPFADYLQLRVQTIIWIGSTSARRDKAQAKKAR